MKLGKPWPTWHGSKPFRTNGKRWSFHVGRCSHATAWQVTFTLAGWRWYWVWRHHEVS